MDEGIRQRPFSVLAHGPSENYGVGNEDCLCSSDYEAFLEELRKVATVVPLEQVTRREAGSIRVGLRLDVDRDLFSALFTARIEYALGLPATYFFLPTSDYYGTWENGRVHRNSGTFEAMRYLQDSLEREIGYHDDCVKLYADFDLEPEVGLQQELQEWRRHGLKPRSICSHNSAYVYGVGSFEVWEGQSIEGRTSAEVHSKPLMLGTLRLGDFGLAYDANFISQVRWRPEPLEMHGQQWTNAEEMSRNVDYLFFLGRGGKCTVHTGDQCRLISDEVPLSDMPKMISERGKGCTWLFMGHPNYFGKLPRVPVLRNIAVDWPPQNAASDLKASREKALVNLGRELVTHSVQKFDAAFTIGVKLFGDRFLLDPKTIRNRIRYHARKHGEGRYWDNARPGVHFMAPYVERACNLVASLAPDLRGASVLDVAGGCGNFGLALSLLGLKRYLLNDTNPMRVEWAKDLFHDYGMELAAVVSDLRALRTEEKFEFVTLLGWENFDVTYDEAIASARKVQKKGGWLLLTYQDHDEYLLGNWPALYQEWHGTQPRFEEGRYTITRRRLTEILRAHGYRMITLMYAGHEPQSRGYYPQYLLCATLP